MPKTPSTAVAEKTEAAAEVATISPAEQAILDAQAAEYDNSELQIPLLKVGQPLTNEVTEGDAAAGEFINSLTREGFGTKIEFITSAYTRGRFASPKDSDRAYVAAATTIPESWADLVGEQFVGTPFSEHPDAEETYSDRANSGEIEWGSGPLISTTHNFTGYVVPDDDSDPEARPIPVRLSLKRTDKKAANKWTTIIRTALRAPWDAVFELSTEKASSKKGTFYNVNVRQGRKSTPEERQDAVVLATAVHEQAITIRGEDSLAENESGRKAGDKAPEAADALAL